MCMHSTQSLSDGAEAGTRPIRRRGRADHVGAGCGAVSLTQQATGEHVLSTNSCEATRIARSFTRLSSCRAAGVVRCNRRRSNESDNLSFTVRWVND